MKRIKVDFDEISLAFDNGFLELSYYLDTQTGEVILLSDDLEDEEAQRQREEIESDALGRFLAMPRLESHEGYRYMEDFIATIQDERLQELLEVAIQGRGAFRRFKDVLVRYSTERERWFSFRDARLRERILAWLAEEEIEPVPKD